MQRLILRSFQSPGDVVMLTAAVRDLHLAAPGRFQTDVRTSVPALWDHNPYLTTLQEADKDVQTLDMHYPLVHQCNQRPYHFLHGYVQYLEERLGLRIPVTRFSGDIHLSQQEKESPPPGLDASIAEHFWIVVAGGKKDFTAKWWNPASFQEVVDHFQGKQPFVQCGEAGHHHHRLRNVVDLVGRTTTREFIRLMYHAAGVLCPVTFAMHLAAAVETKPGLPRHRSCVVVAGGREPPHWEAYPHHQFLSTVGALSCCADGGCWKSRCQLIGDGDEKDRRNLCEQPVQVRPDLRIPRCMTLITPADVIRKIELYYEGGNLRLPAVGAASRAALVVTAGDHSPARLAGPTQCVGQAARLSRVGTEGAHSPARLAGPTEDAASRAALARFGSPGLPPPNSEVSTMNVLIRFRHGLGDSIQLTSLLAHLRHYHPDWEIDVAALVGKHTAFSGLCRRAIALDREKVDVSGYQRVFDLDWHECHTSYPNWPATKAERCLLEVFHLQPIPELCRYTIRRGTKAEELACGYLGRICQSDPGPDGRYPAVLLHYQGNTSGDFKNLPLGLAEALCEDIHNAGMVPVILDWDRRTSLADGKRVHCPGVEEELWGHTGTGDAEALASLIEHAALIVAIDSGPLHVAGATTTPTLAVWLRHHPLHYFGLADNVMHLVPEGHEAHIRGERTIGADFFRSRYKHKVYRDLSADLRAMVQRQPRPRTTADGLVLLHDFWVREDNVAQDLVVVKDVAEEDCYRADAIPPPQLIVADIGAHIGCFSQRVHVRHPQARVVAVECCPENLAALHKNVGSFATVVQAALTYEPEVGLLNAVYSGCRSTGGGTLIGRSELQRRLAAGEIAPQPGPDMPGEYWADLRPLRTLTLEQLMQEQGLDRLDVLKLDCEGSEFSILRGTTSLDRIGMIVGEYHGKEKFLELVPCECFAGWDFQVWRDGDIGLFRLLNPLRHWAATSVRKQAGVNGVAHPHLAPAAGAAK